MSASAQDDVIAHMRRHFGAVQELHMAEVLPVTGVNVHVIRPRRRRDPMILFTTGMSDEPQCVPPGEEDYRFTELFIRVPSDWRLEPLESDGTKYSWPITWLRAIANYPRQNHTWLGGAFSIISNGEPPEPLGEGTNLSCMMLLCETDELNPIRCRDGKLIWLYSLVPLYKEERDLEKRSGMRVLLERLTERGVSFTVNPSRINAAADAR